MSDRICPGRCNNAYRRARAAHDTAWQQWAEADQTFPQSLAAWKQAANEHGHAAGPQPERQQQPGPFDWAPRPGDPIWCPSCTASIRRCLADLDELIPLRLTMTDGYEAPGQALSERVRASKSAPSPSPGQDDLDDLVRWLQEWEIAYRDTQGWSHPPYRGVNAPAFTSAVSWMLQHLDAILRHPDLAEDFGREIFAEHSKLQQVTSTRPPLRHKPLPCPRCKRRSLFLHDDECVRCSNEDCCRVMSDKEYREYEDEADRQVAS